jgi:predicted flap endonuclease-1-like 5' DNA nuclease
MAYKVVDIEGIGKVYGEKLVSAGINTTEELLEKGGSPKGRKELAEAVGVEASRILKWTNMADLFRIKGVSTQYADLLEASGVDTVKELAQRNGDNLAAKMAEVNEAKKLTRAVPSASMVNEWVSQAKDLPRKIEY